jgi:hypothetical protein
MAAQNIYGGLASIGQVKAKIGLAVSVCVALSLCSSGATFIRSALNDKHTSKTTATLLTGQSSCSSNTCSGIASYNVNGRDYTCPGNWGNPLPTSTSISYDPNNIKDCQPNAPSPVLGISLIVAALCVVVIGYVVYTLTMKYKPLAAVEGAGAIYNVGKAFS